ncbi:MAG: ATPase, partial [bacterium]|nr:ATPase [bacterium]
EEVSFEGGVGESYDKEWALKDQAYRDGEEAGEKKGRKEGLEEGSTTKAIEIAKSMLEKNMDIDLISELTGLSIKEIKTLTK